MLSSAAIHTLRQQGALRWPGPLRGDALLLRLGAPLQPLAAPAQAQPVDLLDQASIDRLYLPPLLGWASFTLRPGQLVLCRVADPLRLSPQLGGWIATLSHLARVGLMSHLASPAIMPGWNGHLTLELHNAGPAPLLLRRGMPAAKALLYRLEGPPSQAPPSPYYGTSTHLGSRYADEFAATPFTVTASVDRDERGG
jgi:deoxycytidine triphosphate deaminase